MSEQKNGLATVTIEDVRRVAELASLQLTAEEEPRMQRDLNAILGHIAQLKELDTSAVAPMAQVSEILDAESRPAPDEALRQLRQDAVRPSLERTVVMAGAPDSDGIYFKVPKVIER